MPIFPAGTSTPSIDVTVVDDTGLPVTGLTNATFPSMYYSVGGSVAKTSITLASLTAETDAYASGGVKERGNGVYRLDLPSGVAATAGTNPRVWGDATGKHVLCPSIWIAAITNAGELDVNAKRLGGSNNDFSATMKNSLTTAATAATPTAAAVTAAVSVTGDFSNTMKLSITSAVPTVGQIVTGLWTALLSASDFSTVGSIGKKIKDWVVGTLADGAITSAKYDASTAFPVTSADSGSTRIARTGSDGDTLKTLSDQIDGIVLNPEIVIAIPASTAAASQVSALISILRGDTFAYQLPVMGNITGWTKLTFTAKTDANDLDTAAILQVVLNASGGTNGLIYLNGVAVTDHSTASLSVSDVATGTVQITIANTVAAQLAPTNAKLLWDCQWNFPGGDKTPISGTMEVIADVTRATS